MGEGTLSDGRPYRAELWTEDGVVTLTIFFSADGIHELSRADAAVLLEREGLVEFLGPKRWVSPGPWDDASGHRCWSVNTVLGDDVEVYARELLPLARYAHPTPGPRPRGRWAAIHEASLRESRPDTYRALVEEGSLEDYLDGVEESAQATYEGTLHALMRQGSEPQGYVERVAWLQTLDAQAREIVLQDLLVPDEETERAIREGGYRDDAAG